MRSLTVSIYISVKCIFIIKNVLNSGFDKKDGGFFL